MGRHEGMQSDKRAKAKQNRAELREKKIIVEDEERCL